MRSLYERRAGILIKKYCDGVISLCQAFVQRKWGKKKNDDWNGMGQENGWKILPFRLKVSQIW